MEPSAKKEAGKRKFFPALILIIALVSASFISVKAYLPNENNADLMVYDVDSDTTIKDLKIKDAHPDVKIKSFVRSTVTTYDENGKPHEEVIESTIDEPHTMITIDEMNPPVPELPMLFLQNVSQPKLDIMINSLNGPYLDTLPSLTFHFDNTREMEAFKEEFKMKFSDFYKQNGPEFEKMMKELEGRMGSLEPMNVEFPEVREQIADQAREMAQLDESQHRALKIVAEQDRAAAQQIALMELSSKKMKAFNDAIIAQLFKDGYLKKGEDIHTLNIGENGEVNVNGKTVKEKDRAAYKKIQERYNEAEELTPHAE